MTVESHSGQDEQKNTINNYGKIDDLAIEKINTLASSYANNFSIPLEVCFVDQKDGGIAWVVDDTASGSSISGASSTKKIFINLPTFQQHVKKLTNEVLSVDELLQIALHEVGHLHENAELKIRGPQISNAKTYTTPIINHTLPPFVAQGFDKLSGNTLYDKRQKLIQTTKQNQNTPDFHEFENVIRDIYVNKKSVGFQSGIFALRGVLQSNYTKRAFPGNDWTQSNDKNQTMPKSFQFRDGLLRNAMTPHNPVKLDPQVENKIDIWSNATLPQRDGKPRNIIQMASDEDIPFYIRLPYIFVLYDEYRKFWEKDLEEHKKNQKNNQNEEQQGQENSENKNEGTPPDKGEEGDLDNKKPSNAKKSGIERLKEKLKDILKGKGNEQKGQEGKEDEKTPPRPTDTPQEGNEENKQEGQETQGNSKNKNPFQSGEDQKNSIPHVLEDALGAENLQQIQQALEDAIQQQKDEQIKTPEQKKREQRLRNTSFKDLEKTDPAKWKEKLDLLKRTDNLISQIKSEYSEVIDDIETDVFSKIISKRELRTIENRGPVIMEKGNGTLDSGSAINLVKDSYIGADLTKTPAWHKDTVRKTTEKLAKGFCFHLICDGSSSMSENGGTKNHLQKINTLLILQVLKNLQNELDGANIHPENTTDIYSQGSIFHDSSWEGAGEVTKFKPYSNTLSDEDMMLAMEKLDIASGGTPLHLSLQQVKQQYNNLDQATKDKIKNHEEIYVVMVLSDGQTDQATQDKKMIAELREQGAILCGIGITQSGSPICELFGDRDEGGGYGVVCENPHDLAKNMQDVLVSALGYL